MQTLATYKRSKATKLDFKPRPACGHFWLDLVWLVVVAAVQYAIMPRLLSSYVVLDLMTPWLVVSFILLPLPRSLLLAAFGALLIETHTSAPAGLYLCIYAVTASVLYLLRDSLSWRHKVPWVVTLLIAEAWTIVFESFVLAVTHGAGDLDAVYCLVQFLRLCLATAVGMMLSPPWTGRKLEERSVP